MLPTYRAKSGTRTRGYLLMKQALSPLSHPGVRAYCVHFLHGSRDSTLGCHPTMTCYLLACGVPGGIRTHNLAVPDSKAGAYASSATETSVPLDGFEPPTLRFEGASS